MRNDDDGPRPAGAAGRRPAAHRRGRGIATGAGMLAAFALGAEGCQLGTRFALSRESSACEAFKRRCVEVQEGGTILTLKKVIPTRLVRNGFCRTVEEAESRGADAEELSALIGRGRPKRGIFEGDLDEGNWRSDRSPRSSKTCRRPARSSAVSSPNTKPPAGASARSDPSRNTESLPPPGCERRPAAAPSSCRRHRKAPGPGAKVSCSRSCGGRNRHLLRQHAAHVAQEPSRCRRHRRSCSPAACGIRRRTDG